jgi:hypothetical protein
MTATITAPMLPLPGVTGPEVEAPRPGSRASRMALPLALDALKDMAAEHGVCLRPISMRRTNIATGQTEVIDLPCGSTREDKCVPCSKLRLRQTQIREGWHRSDEPLPGPAPATPEQRSLIALRAHFEFERAAAEHAALWDQVAELDEAITEVEEAIAAEGLRGRIAPPHNDNEDQEQEQKRKRSTRRRQDAPDLPRQKVAPRTVGRTYTAPDGTVYRPSTWLTLTLDSYGPVHTEARGGRSCPCGHLHAKDSGVLGTPLDRSRYDYRRAAWDAVHFPRLLDRFWQNLRRCAGWNVQYAGCVEPQRRLAPHAHFAVRGTLPRVLIRQVAAATYHQVWWPSVNGPMYGSDHLPVWDDELGWLDPDTRQPLTTWDQALDAIDADDDAEPVHVVRFGTQIDVKGVEAGTDDAKRLPGYITKYITKTAASCHKMDSDPQRDHLERLWQELRRTPCSDRCANWLLFGIVPKKAHARLRPGRCKGKVHQRETLGIGGRRVLVSREWSGKTLADHKYDARAWVKALLGATGTDEEGSEDTGPVLVEPDAFAWEMARPDDPDVSPLAHRLLRAVSERMQWRRALLTARDRAAQGALNVSATTGGIDGEEQ